jgi:general secretion pathway protein I
MIMTFPSPPRGMTLLEVMVAMVIFAITATAILKATGEHLNSVGQIEEITFASYVANNRLTEAHLESSWPPKNKQKGSQEMAGRTWYWQQQILTTSDKDFRAIEVSVSLDPEHGSSITTVTSYLAKPTGGK